VVITAAGESGMPTNTEERVANASRMVKASQAAGIQLDQLIASSTPSRSSQASRTTPPAEIPSDRNGAD
jgi:hypothetical protein